MYGTCSRLSTSFCGSGSTTSTLSSALRISGLLCRSISPRTEATTASPSRRALGTSAVRVSIVCVGGCVGSDIASSLPVADQVEEPHRRPAALAGHLQQHAVRLRREAHVVHHLAQADEPEPAGRQRVALLGRQRIGVHAAAPVADADAQRAAAALVEV